MADQLALVLMVAAVVVLLATVLVWLRPLLTPSRSAPASSGAAGTGPARSTPSAALAHGFGYLFSPLGLPRRQISLTGRLDRALSRIAAVDPYVNHRRIGLALLADPLPADPQRDNPEHDDATDGPLPPAAAPAAPWPFRAENERRETTDD